MKICEYENVRCPYCGSDHLAEMGLGTAKYGVEMTNDGPKVAEVKVHAVRCVPCGGMFLVPCED